MFNRVLNVWLCRICVCYMGISLLIITLASYGQVIFKLSLYVYVIFVYTLPNLKQKLKKSHFLENSMKLSMPEWKNSFQL